MMSCKRLAAGGLFSLGVLFSLAAGMCSAGAQQTQSPLYSGMQQNDAAPLQQQDSPRSYSAPSIRTDDSSSTTLRANPVLTSPQSGQNEPWTDQRMQSPALPREPQRLSDFQRLVAASINKILPIYGSNLFLTSPTTFSPVNRVPVTPEYIIGPGDELLIRLWGQVTLDGHFTVDRSGAVYIPQVGAIHVAGIPFVNLTDFLRSQIGRVFHNFDLNVNMGQLRSIQIFVVGEAKHPGSYTISSLSTLVNAVFASGGPSSVGSLRAIQLRRNDKIISTFDFYDFLLKGDKSKDVPLISGDVIYIPSVGPMVALAGVVDHPAIYEMRAGNTLNDLLRLSGGFSTLARRNEVRIEQISQTEDSRAVKDIAINETGMATPLNDGDIIEVTPIIDRFKNSVTLRGNVADPRRFSWKPGLRIRDIIPDRDALLTRNYWEQRNQLGLPILDSTPEIRTFAPEDATYENNIYTASQEKGRAKDSVNTLRDRTLMSTKQDSRMENDERHAQSAGNMASVDSTDSTLVENRTPKNDSNLRNSTALSLESDNQGSTMGGSVSKAVTGVSQRFKSQNAVVLSAPEVDWAYAVVQRLNPSDLSSELLPFDLGKAIIDGDPSQNLELQPGDVVTIFSKADIRVPQEQQTKFVRLEGEFLASGIYRVKPGENLRQLVARAGGLTKQAYLYGSEFSRESTRVLQQQRLNEYADDLDRRVQLAEANAANKTLSPDDKTADIAALQNARTVAASLRRLKADGRIVLDIPTNAVALDAIPELPLEDGDTFIVPQTPVNISVYGSVYAQQSFLFDMHKRAGDYIRMAGGGTRTADTARSYILRANGAIVSRHYSTALFTGNFDSVHLNPGDAIVIPEQVDKRPLLRNLVDIATIVGQFGLGIAAVNVLR